MNPCKKSFVQRDFTNIVSRSVIGTKKIYSKIKYIIRS